MKYLDFDFTLTPSTPDFEDVLEAVLAAVGFDSFVKSEDGTTPLKAYVKVDDFDEDTLKATLADFPIPGVSITYTYTEAEDKDWNEEWEKNYFTPLNVDGKCVVKATFHHDVEPAEYNITINPRMSFGTGHHETTWQMLHEILEAPMQDKSVLDMGCGTSILAILASLRGARHVTAVDVDEWCVKNSKENYELNGITNIDVHLGDASILKDYGPFDVIFANIHLNIILGDMKTYVSRLNPGGLFLTSGFYADDLPKIQAEAERLGLTFLHASDQRRWCCAAFRNGEN